MTFEIKFPDLFLDLDKSFVKRVLRQSARQVVNDAKALINKAPGPSAPGDAPHSHTGELRSDLRVRPGKGLSVKMSDDAYYALALEGGALGGGGQVRNKRRRVGKQRIIEASTKRTLLPRPFLSTALDNDRADITRQIEQAIRTGLDLKALRNKTKA